MGGWGWIDVQLIPHKRYFFIKKMFGSDALLGLMLDLGILKIIELMIILGQVRLIKC